MSNAPNAAPMSRAETQLHLSCSCWQVVLFLIPLIVLGQAIGWPASLRLPAAEALPLIARNAHAVQIGYWGYLMTATAMIPLVLALHRHARAQGVSGLVLDTMAAFGIAAAVLKTLGIVRWLIAMPTLAQAHGATADPALRQALEIGYLALNSYAGSVGELLGVQWISGLWLILLGIVLARASCAATVLPAPCLVSALPASPYARWSHRWKSLWPSCRRSAWAGFWFWRSRSGASGPAQREPQRIETFTRHSDPRWIGLVTRAAGSTRPHGHACPLGILGLERFVLNVWPGMFGLSG